MRPGIHLFAFAIAAAVTVAPSLSNAQSCPPVPLWQFQNSITQVASDTPFGQGLSFFAYGPTLFAVWNESGSSPAPHSAGDTRWVWSSPSGATIDNFPIPVPLSSGGEYLFVAAHDGFLYKLDASTGVQSGNADTRRSSCSGDQVLATPAIQLYAYSNSEFQSDMISRRGHPDDLVFVISQDGCEDHANNRVLAYYASDLTVKWIFNSTGAYSMDYGSDACAVDYTSDRVICGTNQTTPSQNTVWAINTVAGGGGGLVWSANAGSVLTRPMVGEHKLYIGHGATISKLDLDTGATLWAFPNPTPVIRNASPEFNSPLPTRICYTTTDGLFHCIQDDTTAAAEVWPPVGPGVGSAFTTQPAVAPALNKAFVGRDDGYMQQIDIGSGVAEAIGPVGARGAVWDPSIDVSVSTAQVPDRLMVPTTAGMVVRFCVPWGSTTAVSEPASIADYALQSAPNPFSANTRIAYSLPYAARVEIDLYDVAGHRVRALVREQQPAGRHEVEWNGLDDAGRATSTGVYFYRLRAVGSEGRTLERAKKVQRLR